MESKALGQENFPWFFIRELQVCTKKIKKWIFTHIFQIFIETRFLSSYLHPVDDRECPVVIGGDYITTESGTGLVHTAPGHGQEDYITGMKYGLPIISPVDDAGKFTKEAGIFSGLDVLGDGNSAVVKFLDEKFSLVLEEPYSKLCFVCLFMFLIIR